MERTIMFVDDERSVLSSIKWSLDDEPFDFLFLVDPKEALTKFEGRDIIAVVADHFMPEMDGIDFLKQVRKISPDTVRIMMTAHADVDLAIRAINQGNVYRMILKPWDEVELRMAIQNAVAHYELVSENKRLLELTTKQNETLKKLNQDLGKTVVARDKEILKNEEKRRVLEDLLGQSQKLESVGRLAGGVAHDFNNMLSVIIGHSEFGLAKIDPEDPLYPEFEEILKAAKRSSDITHKLLAFARKQSIEPKVLNLNDTVEGMLKMLSRLMRENIDLAWRPYPNLWPVKMDPVQIDQILANLCVNARDAIEGVGKITIETENIVLNEDYCAEHMECMPGEFVMLAVNDNGSGMEKETLANVFEPFFTTKEPGKGTGLGLSMVYGIVKQNRGFINTYSEPGKGTTFKIYLPRHCLDCEPAPQEDKEPIPHGRGETILFVEDEPSVLKVSKRILERLGYTVLAAERPSEALEIAHEYAEEINLLMTDMVMPEMNGESLAEEIIKIRPNVKTLFISGYAASTIASNGVLKKGGRFIQKPFTGESMARKVRDVLDRI